MGLDTVELVMEIEGAFDIQIPDDRASEIHTVGELYDYILAVKRDLKSVSDVCLSAATFYLIRRALCAELGLKRRSLRPQTALEATIDRSGRRKTWANLESATNLTLPPLARSDWVTILAACISLTASAVIAFLAYRPWGSNGAFATLVVSLIVIGLLAKQITVPFQTEFRQSFATYRGLANVVLAHNYAAISSRYNSSTPSDTWHALQTIIAEQTGVKPEAVTRNARFSDFA